MACFFGAYHGYDAMNTMPVTPKDPFPDAPKLLLAELLYESNPNLSGELFRSRLDQSGSQFKVVSSSEDTILIEHPGGEYTDVEGRKIPPLTSILQYAVEDLGRFETAIRQTWDWPQARDLVGKAAFQITVTEMISRTIERSTRVINFLNVLWQVIEIAKPLAIHCHHAERIVDPARLRHASGSTNPTERMIAILNVRLFRVDGGEAGETIMDTRGLAALWLPDLQVHSKNLPANSLAALLVNSAMYIYEHGDCIEDGHTIQGLNAEDRWKCRHEVAIVAPKRPVIDICPNAPFAAGRRRTWT